MEARTVNYSIGEKLVQRIALSHITQSHNPREPVPNVTSHLAEEGHPSLTPMELVHTLALSEDPAKKAEYVRLIEKYETHPKGLLELAASRRLNELEPILIRDFRLSGTDEAGKRIVRFGIVCGERRFMAAAYNHAKHGDSATVGAVVKKMTVTEGMAAAVEENFNRQDMSDLEIGISINQWLEKDNPATGKKFTLPEVAEKFHMEYQYARGRQALAAYLPEADKNKLREGTLGVTKAVEKALSIKTGREDANANTSVPTVSLPSRTRVMTRKEIQALFDATPRKNKERLAALAEVMRQPMEEALLESDMRIELASLKETA